MSNPMTTEELLETLEEWINDSKSYDGASSESAYNGWMSNQLLYRRMADAARALLAENAELRSRLTPRPIEESPKDERVLVFCPQDHDYGYLPAWVIGEKVAGQWEGNMQVEDGVQPTHFLPLPPHPSDDPTTETEL